MLRLNLLPSRAAPMHSPHVRVHDVASINTCTYIAKRPATISLVEMRAKDVDWASYAGRSIRVRYDISKMRFKEYGTDVLQDVVRFDALPREAPHLVEPLAAFIEVTRMLPRAARTLGTWETGQFLYITEQNVYKSAVFTSRSRREITADDANAAFSQFVDFLNEQEVPDYVELAFLHTHPFTCPLSVPDRVNLETYAGGWGVKPGQSMHIYAVCRSAELLFRHTIA